MSESLLIAPEPAQGLDAALGGLEGLRKLFVEQTRALVPLVLNMAESSRAVARVRPRGSRRKDEAGPRLARRTARLAPRSAPGASAGASPG